GAPAFVCAGRKRLVAVSLLLMLGVATGMLRETASTTIAPNDIGRYAADERNVTLIGTVYDDPVSRQGRITCLVSVCGLEGAAGVSGTLYTTLQSDALDGVTLRYGDGVRLHGTLSIPRGAANPGGFSWRDYLARREVYATLLV